MDHFVSLDERGLRRRESLFDFLTAIGHQPIVCGLLFCTWVLGMIAGSVWTRMRTKTIAVHDAMGKWLKRAVETDDVDTVRLLCKKWGSEESVLNWRADDGYTPLLVASIQGFNGVAAELLAQSAIDVNKADPNGSTALARSAFNGRMEVLRQLMAHPHCDLNKVDKFGASALLRACQSKKIDCCQLLLAHTSTDATLMDNKGTSPLLLSCATGDVTIVDAILLSKAGRRDINRANEKGVTPLMRCAEAGSKSHVACIKMLLAQPSIDPNRQDSSGRTALHYAAAAGRDLVLNVLLPLLGLEVNKPPKDGSTALIECCAAGHARCVKLMLALGAPYIEVRAMRDDGSTALSVSAAYPEIEALISSVLRNIEFLD